MTPDAIFVATRRVRPTAVLGVRISAFILGLLLALLIL
ncbi:hypothetical protein BH24ACT5_BH24ACT5_08570 [soil metagenome]|jgi:hypothetical protein